MHNGGDDFYFDASPNEVYFLIRLFSEARMRDHELWFKVREEHAKSFEGDEIPYNVHLRVPGGLGTGMYRRAESLSTYEPTLTIFVDPGADEAFWEQVALILAGHTVFPDNIILHDPDNITLHNDRANIPVTLRGKASKPERKVWSARLQFDEAMPAADYEHGLRTKVTFWEKGIETGIPLGEVSHEGYFHVPLSDQEIADLKAGNTWLTLTVGNWATKAKPDHPRLSVDALALDVTTAEPTIVNKPGL